MNASPLESALEIWQSARCAAGEPPTPDRVRRVADKLADPDALLLVEARDGIPAGMLLAEPFQTVAGDGSAAHDGPDRSLTEGSGHVSMVFVHPDHRRQGVGRTLIDQVQRIGRWQRLSLWTRESNHAARGLYRSCGFVPTADVSYLESLGEVRRWQWTADEVSA